jgi:hypothetical protein
MKTLKGYIRNKVRMERNMAKGYALEEALGFCTKYLQDFTTTRRRVWDDKENLTMVNEILEGGGHPLLMDADFQDMAYSFVLHNVKLMATWCI